MIVFDTNVFITLLNNEKPMIHHVQALLAQLSQPASSVRSSQRDIVGVPTIVLSELWVSLPRSEHTKFLLRLPVQVQPLSFDIECASICADLLQAARGNPPVGVSNTRIKKDILIIATAKAHKARRIYTEDEKFCELANSLGVPCMLVKDIPPIPDQERLL